MPTALQALSLMKGRFSWIIYDAGVLNFPFLHTDHTSCSEFI